MEQKLIGVNLLRNRERTRNMSIHGKNHKYQSTGKFNSDRPTNFNWGGIIVFLLLILTIVGMGIYQKYFK